jgi:hypothetical protein
MPTVFKPPLDTPDSHVDVKPLTRGVDSNPEILVRNT